LNKFFIKTPFTALGLSRMLSRNTSSGLNHFMKWMRANMYTIARAIIPIILNTNSIKTPINYILFAGKGFLNTVFGLNRGAK